MRFLEELRISPFCVSCMRKRDEQFFRAGKTRHLLTLLRAPDSQVKYYNNLQVKPENANTFP